jgi:hypothetical protein
MNKDIPVAYAVPIAVSAPIAYAVPVDVSPIGELSEKEWLQKYHPGRYDFKEEDMKGFPDVVKQFIRTWTKVEDSYLFFESKGRYDEENTKAAAVLEVRGTDAAVKYMMSMANGSYSQMRSMYG